MKTFFFGAIVLVFATLIPACKKDQGSNSSSNSTTDTAFTGLIKLVDFVPVNHYLYGMDYHSPSKNLYFFMNKQGAKGYFIMQLNTETKQALTVFSFDDGKWANSNGSEGQRIRIFGNDLYVMGGASNTDFHRLTGMGNNTLTLAKVIKMPVYPGPHWGESYDVAVADKLYVMTMRSKITYGNLNDLSTPGSFAVNTGSHGASIAYAAKDGNAYLLSKSKYEAKIEARNPINGNFLRAVTIGSSNGTSISKDSKDRIYILEEDKILRYSPDLLTKEEFIAKNAGPYYQFAIAEESNHIRIYQQYNGEIKSIRLPL
jgi:hypothetical protein